jgi:CHAT domain-containing protein
MRPERPPTFRNIGEPFIPLIPWSDKAIPDAKKRVWGRSLKEDLRMFRWLRDCYQEFLWLYDSYPEKVPTELAPNHYLYLLLLFGETLVDLPQHTDDDHLFYLVVNVANVAQRSFKATGSPEAARMTLDIFEHAASMLDDAVPVSIALRNFGQATSDVLRTFNKGYAAVVTRRPDLRERTLEHLREALRLVDDVADRDPEGAHRQRLRTLWALADLLSLGQPTTAEWSESREILTELPIDELGIETAPFARAARAIAILASELPAEPSKEAVEPYRDAVQELAQLMHEATLVTFGNRWRWALAVGQFLMRLGSPMDAQYYLESAVTFILKDTPFRSERLIATADAELYHQAFGVLAGHYASIGWWFEALSLLETYRGRTVELASLTEEDRRERALQAERLRAKRYFGISRSSSSANIIEENMLEKATGQVFGPFHEDYELPGLSDRLLALFEQLSGEDTALISMSIDDTTLDGRSMVSAVILGPPQTPPRQGKYRVWVLEDETMRMLTSDLYRRPSSFREARLEQLGNLAFEHLIEPMREDLEFFACRRALLVTPSSLSNLPFEAFLSRETRRHSDLLPTHFAFTPSFQFRAHRPPHPRRRGHEKLLIVGYDGADLPHADREATVLRSVFGENASYLPGRACTKKRVVEELNRDYDFIHFICHGMYDSDDPGESALYFRDSRSADAYRLRSRELRDFVRLSHEPVVTLSACSTALTADSKSNTWQGLPGSLLECGARCVVGTRWPVADRVAEQVMGRMYELMLSTGHTPMECLHMVQDEARDRRPIEEWACFGYLGPP